MNYRESHVKKKAHTHNIYRMVQPWKLSQKVSEDIFKILRMSKTESCSVYVIKYLEEDLKYFATYRAQNNGQLQRLPKDDGTLVYPLGSLTKIFIEVALHLMVDVYRISGKSEHMRYRRITGWNQQYVDAINHFSGHKVLESLDGNPTLLQLSIHFKGLPDVNRFVLAPNGLPIMSDKEFFKLANRLTAAAEWKYSDWLEYSNGNYILIGLLIEAISKMPLGEFLKEHILRPLRMDRTYVDARQVNDLPASLRALPYITNRLGKREAINDQTFASDAIGIASLGIYSCTRDLGRLYTSILPMDIENPSSSIYNESAFHHLFGYKDDPSEEQHLAKTPHKKLGDEKWIPMGMTTGPDSLRIGSRSINRRVMSENGASVFKLGTTHGKTDRRICYQAGSVWAFNDSSYVVFEPVEIVIVLSNTLGAGDAADYISRLVLQDCSDLKFSKVDLLHHLQSRHGKVDIVGKAHKGSKIFSSEWSRKWEICDVQDDPKILDAWKLGGVYTDDRFGQTLTIKADENKLSVEVGASEPMRLARTGKGKLKICLERPSSLLFDAWKDLELFYEAKGTPERVSCLSSKVMIGAADVTITYKLQPQTI